MSLGILAILPPIVAILAAVATRKVLQSLLLGIFVASFLVAGNDAFDSHAWPKALLLTFVFGFVKGVEYIVNGIADGGHAGVITFTLFLGGLVAVLQQSGAVRGFGELAMRYASTPRRGQTIAWLVGTSFLAIDDYFHVIASGAIFRPVTDKLKVSREKLAYIIDSTAAPMVIMVPISTWVGFILGVATTSLTDLGMDQNAFSLFLEAIPFNVYALATVLFVGVVVLSGRDWGPMLAAERRARTTGKVLADGAKPLVSDELSQDAPDDVVARARNLILPVLFLFASSIAMLYVTGIRNGGEGFVGALQNASAELSLAISSFLTLLFTLALLLLQGQTTTATFADSVEAGCKGMVPALLILGLAWGIGNAVSDDGGVGLGGYLAEVVGDGFNGATIPILAFIISAAAAFATGTSFGTFALMIPVGFALVSATGDVSALAPTLAATLGGAVFGDHASPISDTTVMSSMAAHSDHIDHVRTQFPYALTTAIVAIAGYGAYALWGTGLALGLAAAIALALFSTLHVIVGKRA